MSGEELYSMWCDSLAPIWPRPSGVTYAGINAPTPPRKPVAWQFLAPLYQRGWAGVAQRLGEAERPASRDGALDFGFGLLLDPTDRGIEVKVRGESICFVTRDEMQRFLDRAYGQ